LRAVKLPVGPLKEKVVALSNQANQAGVPTVIDPAAGAVLISVSCSTRAVVRAMA
jgi:hypothetical protein